MKYHLGCGSTYLDGYWNVDFPQDRHTQMAIRADEYGDILRMDYKPCEEIRSNHVFEHFSYYESMALLYKWTVALSIGGILRIGVPDVAALCKVVCCSLLQSDRSKVMRVMRLLYGSHEAEWAYHINGWTAETLTMVLEAIGYTVERVTMSGDHNHSFPNMNLDVVAKKVRESPDLDLTCGNLLASYCDLPVEDNLFEYLKGQYRALIR